MDAIDRRNQSQRARLCVLQRGGWDIDFLEICLVPGVERIRADLINVDGYRLFLDWSAGRRASITRTLCTPTTVQVGAGGGVGREMRTGRIEERLLGRSWYDGGRSAMRGLARLVADNSGGRLALAHTRAALRLALSSEA
jgi:hypothetical protein